MTEKISYAKTVYGQDEINAVVDCLNESTQMGKKIQDYLKIKLQKYLKKNIVYMLTQVLQPCILE